MQNTNQINDFKQVEKIQNYEKIARAKANELWRSYINETNIKKATLILKEWDKAMKESHNLTNQRHQLLFGKKAFRKDWNIYEDKKQTNYLSLIFSNYARY